MKQHKYKLLTVIAGYKHLLSSLILQTRTSLLQLQEFIREQSDLPPSPCSAQ